MAIKDLKRRLEQLELELAKEVAKPKFNAKEAANLLVVQKAVLMQLVKELEKRPQLKLVA